MTMRKKLIAVAAAATVTAATLLAYAPARFHHRGHWKEFLGSYLNLTDNQKASADSIFAAARAQAEPIVVQLKATHDAMRAAVKEGRPATEIQQIADRQGALIGQVSGIYAKAFAQFYKELTPEQKQKADDLHDMVRSRMESRFRARP